MTDPSGNKINCFPWDQSLSVYYLSWNLRLLIINFTVINRKRRMLRLITAKYALLDPFTTNNPDMCILELIIVEIFTPEIKNTPEIYKHLFITDLEPCHRTTPLLRSPCYYEHFFVCPECTERPVTYFFLQPC